MRGANPLTDEMIERVARAIAEKRHYIEWAHNSAEIGQLDQLDKWLLAFPAKVLEVDRECARAAIKAMPLGAIK